MQRTEHGSDEVCVGNAVVNASSKPKTANHLLELEGHTSASPGMRAERAGRIPAAVLPKPPQMLDSTPVKCIGAHASPSRSSVFLEHMSEMDDTVSDIHSLIPGTLLTQSRSLANIGQTARDHLTPGSVTPQPSVTIRQRLWQTRRDGSST